MKRITEMGICRGIVLSIILSLFCVVIHALLIEAYADDTATPGTAERHSHALKEVSGEGRAPVPSDDQIGPAREQAVAAAKLDALFAAAGQYVNREILLKERAKLGKRFSPQVDDLLEDCTVVSENREADGTLRVSIEATVRREKLKDLLLKSLDGRKVIVITSERSLGVQLKRNLLEPELSRLAREKGYTVVDFRTIRNKTVSELVASIRGGNTESVGKMGLYFLADKVIVGFIDSSFSQQTNDIYSARSSGQVKVHRIGARNEAAFVTRYDGKGFGSDKDKAGLDAVAKGAQKLALDMVKSLGGAANGHTAQGGAK